MTPRILFVHNHPAKFVRIDLSLLSERYAVREWYQRTRVVNLPALARAVAHSDLVFGWFASWHTFFPVLLARGLHRPSVLVVGGYDTANLPEIGYGNQRGGVKRWISRTTMKSVTRLIANSRFTRDEAIRNAGVSPDRVATIYHGLDATKPIGDGLKQNGVVTVANVDRSNLQRKGLEALVRTAAELDGVPIVLIGAWRDNTIKYLCSIASPNVRFTGWVSDAELDDYLARAKVYVQASRHEGFGLAVAEAMLRECVPVVTRAGALPEVVGEAGIFIDSSEPKALAEGIRRALAAGSEWGRRARERIVHNFPLERRKEQMYQLIDLLLVKNE